MISNLNISEQNYVKRVMFIPGTAVHQTVRTDYLQQGDQFERNDYAWHFTASFTEDFLRKHPQI